MKVVAAYLLAVLGGKTTPTAEDLKDNLGYGKDITELIASGREKLASVPAGGGGAVAVAATGCGCGGGGGAAAAAAEAKKEEKKIMISGEKKRKRKKWKKSRLGRRNEEIISMLGFLTF
ncbi:60S acidic ribosomal protein P2-2-like [Pyrus ussuriensis x Pyrus communis]|uniref:60S acidic ribosomal protein P2-2-like n=1 Tax=Pyrus ussuriensis x Pyrus communis TaxID=2448454 RepID=A0A5N5HLY5_9ROSA|nr:60S acidic ribosomal protein P2-2-like [Pyrus ussuriensis x Pyrus communis]